jgi:hypothetical protein
VSRQVDEALSVLATRHRVVLGGKRRTPARDVEMPTNSAVRGILVLFVLLLALVVLYLVFA